MGLSPHVLRAWERRYEAVRPVEPPADPPLPRVRRDPPAAARSGDRGRPSDRGHRQALRAELDAAAPTPGGAAPPPRRVLEAIDQLDADRQSALRASRSPPWAPCGSSTGRRSPDAEVGDRWEDGSLCVAGEHLASGASAASWVERCAGSRGHLGQSHPLHHAAGRRHELCTLACAVIAVDLGVNATDLGPDLPAGEAAAAAGTTRAGADAISTSRVRSSPAARAGGAGAASSAAGRGGTLARGSGSEGLSLPAGAERIEGIEELEQKIRSGVRR